ncbi:MAG: rhodanese-like domain-containing protein [Chitinophagaceae bacterium]|nr:rhodanese-like domain-containing protein [Chitinophagaceae bacterium]
MKYFTVAQLQNLLKENDSIVLVDTRSASEFTDGFIPGAVFIGHEGNMAEWATALLSPRAGIVLITAPGKETYYAEILEGKGLEITGCLDGGFEAWKDAGGPIDMIINVDAGELAMDIPFDENLLVLDVRKPFEFADGHIKDARNLPLDELKDPGNIANLEENQNIYIHCARGYRSVIAASLLKQQGYDNIRNVTGGWDSIKHTKGFTIEKESSALN